MNREAARKRQNRKTTEHTEGQNEVEEENHQKTRRRPKESRHKNEFGPKKGCYPNNQTTKQQNNR